LNIEPCPPIKKGRGNVITGTFHHEAANTIDLHVEGLPKPIGCTDNHPFWSVTRQEFVEAGKLQQGEELQLYNGQTTKVVQILPRPGPERVHNLEVLNEHVYRVTQEGVLVHNACVQITPKSPLPMRNVTSREAVRILRENDFREVRQEGSHLVLKHENGNTVIVPMHSGTTLKQGTLNSIWKMAGLK
jgi:predicted RNA binding protein YcfA (HicA-like mRNA interferase family)